MTAGEAWPVRFAVCADGIGASLTVPSPLSIPLLRAILAAGWWHAAWPIHGGKGNVFHRTWIRKARPRTARAA